MRLPTLPLFAAMTGVLLGGCATLPASGPTARQVRQAEVRDNAIGFRIVDVDGAQIEALNAAPGHADPLAALAAAGQVDTIGTGDVLDISIYEVGVALFGGAQGNAAGGGFDPTARPTILQNIKVDASGQIALPYVGRIKAAGRTPAEVERLIEQGMMGLSQRPQAVVTIKENLYNVIYVSGDVRTPGRLALGLPRERLLDAIARAGGTVSTSGTTGAVQQPNDIVVRLTRGGQSRETRLSEIEPTGTQNVELLPGDRIELFNRPRTYLVFGATDRVSQVPFSASDLSLAEAMARIGGPSERVADPAAVYVFRYQAGSDAGAPAGQPTIYRLNMMRAESYFLSQRFHMQDKDVILVASAAANAPAKLAQIIGTLFSPITGGAILYQQVKSN